MWQLSHDWYWCTPGLLCQPYDNSHPHIHFRSLPTPSHQSPRPTTHHIHLQHDSTILHQTQQHVNILGWAPHSLSLSNSQLDFASLVHPLDHQNSLKNTSTHNSPMSKTPLNSCQQQSLTRRLAHQTTPPILPMPHPKITPPPGLRRPLYDTDNPPPLTWTNWNGPLTSATNTNHIIAKFVSDLICVTVLVVPHYHYALLISQLNLNAGGLGILIDPRSRAIPDFMLNFTTSTRHATNGIHLNKHLHTSYVRCGTIALLSWANYK
jgi:hypothetical protein